MSLIKRIERVEALLGMNDTDPGTEAVIIFCEDHARDAAPSQPVTMFTFSGQQIHRQPEESYQNFEARALKAALELLGPRLPGAAAPVPTLIANGSLQQ